MKSVDEDAGEALKILALCFGRIALLIFVAGGILLP